MTTKGGLVDMDSGAVRNLDDIQEADPAANGSRLGALVLASLGGACIVFAAVALLRTPAKVKPVSADPLGDLVARAQPAGKPEHRDDGLRQGITFPGVLSDNSNTTALEAVRQSSSSQVVEPSPPSAFARPPAPTDRLPITPVPAQDVLQPHPEGAPDDTLGAMAKHASRDQGGETVPAGGAGGYQLQVSSFKTPAEAESFAAALRRRGHKAYVEPAYVKGRGLWHRVRIGPFKYRHSAVVYRQDFEAKERMVTFIIDPPKTTVRIRDDDADSP
jgi:cell division septation protein DedD